VWRERLVRLVVGLLVVVVLLLAVAALRPVPRDPAVPPEAYGTGAGREPSPAGEESSGRVGTVLVVEPGQTIQEVVDRARPGDVVEVPYGVYNEQVVVAVDNLTLRGVPNAQGEWPILDGQNTLTDGVVVSADGFEMAFFRLRNYTDNGVLAERVRGVYLHDLVTERTGTYGVYPVHCNDALIERVVATGINDAGIYAGQCENVIIRDSEAYGNVIGIEVENTDGFEIYNNRAYDNALGIFVDLLPQLEAKVSLRGKVYDNVSENNNGENFAPPDSLAAQVPSGLGLFILAADQNEVYNNVIRGNKTAGIAVFNLSVAFEEEEIDVGPNPEDNWIHDNVLENNGFDPDPSVRELGIPGADILWDGSGDNNRFDQPGATSFPPVLPSSRWPTPFYRLYWNVLNVLVSLIS